MSDIAVTLDQPNYSVNLGGNVAVTLAGSAISANLGAHNISVNLGGNVTVNFPASQPGAGVPTGGTTGQVLAKASGTDYDTEWSDSASDALGTGFVNGGGSGNIPTGTTIGLAENYVTIFQGASAIVTNNDGGGIQFIMGDGDGTGNGGGVALNGGSGAIGGGFSMSAGGGAIGGGFSMSAGGGDVGGGFIMDAGQSFGTGQTGGGFGMNAGASDAGTGGYVNISAGDGGDQGGKITLRAGYGGNTMGTVEIQDPSTLSRAALQTSPLSADRSFFFPDQSGILSTVTSDSTTPSSTPSALGQIFIDTSAGKVYISVGTSSSADWKILN